MLENRQGLRVSIFSNHRAANLQRRVEPPFPDECCHFQMDLCMVQAECLVPVLLRSHCCQGLQRHSVASELPTESCPSLDGIGRLQSFPSSLTRPCLTVLPPRGCIPPAVLTYRTLILLFSAP